MANLLKSPKRKFSDDELVTCFLVSCYFLETKEEWEMMKRSLYSALTWAKNVNKRKPFIY